MTPGLPMRVASVSLIRTLTVLGAFLTGDLFSPPVSAMPPDIEPDWRAENAVARKSAGAIRGRDPNCVEEVKPRPELEERKGKLRPPVRGAVTRHFGEKNGKGRPSRGITLGTEPGAQVVAPFDSTIMYAGPPPEHGQLLILSARGGYHYVLAGMTKIYGVKGQNLLEGEPVGIMLASRTKLERPELYFEIRKNGKPMNPLPWLATAKLERTSP